MELLLFSDDGHLVGLFQGFGSKRSLALPRQVPVDRLGSWLRSPEIPREGVLVFLDRGGLRDDEELLRTVRRLARTDGIVLAVIDPADQVPDPAFLFHLGVVDYLGSRPLPAGITPQRVRRMIDYARSRTGWKETAPLLDPGSERDPVAPRGWEEIVAGREYSFFLMYIELDGQAGMESRYGKKNLALALASFRQFVSRQVEPAGGRIWHWSRFGGLVLFPRTAEPQGFIECGLRLMMFKSLYDVEESLFPAAISFRMVLHLGQLVYEEANKGQVVADALNTVFHLGQQFAQEGNGYLSEEVLPYAPAGLHDLFVPVGEYDGRKMYRLRSLVH